jgi:hypothetical protein
MSGTRVRAASFFSFDVMRDSDPLSSNRACRLAQTSAAHRDAETDYQDASDKKEDVVPGGRKTKLRLDKHENTDEHYQSINGHDA